MKIKSGEFNASLNNVAGDASKLPYDNSESQLEATTIQEAVDEVNDAVDSLNDIGTIQELLQNKISIKMISGGTGSVSSGFEISINNGDKLFQFETDTSNHLWVRVKWTWGNWSSWKQLI